MLESSLDAKLNINKFFIPYFYHCLLYFFNHHDHLFTHTHQTLSLYFIYTYVFMSACVETWYVLDRVRVNFFIHLISNCPYPYFFCFFFFFYFYVFLCIILTPLIYVRFIKWKNLIPVDNSPFNLKFTSYINQSRNLYDVCHFINLYSTDIYFKIKHTKNTLKN